MRNLNLILLLLIGLMSCQPEFDELEAPVSRVESLSGTWKLVSVKQIDEKAVSKGYPAFVQEIELTERAGFNDYQLVINQNEEGQLTGFEEVATDSPFIIGIESGNISLDDPLYPEVINFSNASGESFSLSIKTYLGLDEGELTLGLTRIFEEEPIVSYIYKFEKI